MNTTDTKEKKLLSEKDPAGDRGRNEDESSGMPAAKKNTKPRSKSPSIERFDQLLRSVYSGEFKRSTLNKKELAAMCSNPLPTEVERKKLLGLAQSDLSLDRTRQLMLLGLRVEGAITGKIGDFAREVLLQHPLFQTDSLAGVLRNLPESATEEKAISALLSQEIGSVPWPEQNTAMTKSQFTKCKSNAVHCLLMVFRATRSLSINRIMQCLNLKLWAPADRRHNSEQDKLFVLISTRDPVAASLIFGLLESAAYEQQRRAENALRSKERAEERVADLERQIANVGRKLEEAEVTAKSIQKELVAATQSHVIETIHWKDDYEKLRGQMRRRMKEELELLDEGLHALHREPPKVHVMIDHAERAIDGLKREMERLRESE